MPCSSTTTPSAWRSVYDLYLHVYVTDRRPPTAQLVGAVERERSPHQLDTENHTPRVDPYQVLEAPRKPTYRAMTRYGISCRVCTRGTSGPSTAAPAGFMYAL
ncbi:hypothetical protein Vretimale_10097 [Volvox reticuliferus]|uniref:Uncharacterized protein n=1 Tax=Volvox reticuliferus TaxID=1737510 RepID=A0A8J4LQZ3_9CHLO|nr:hypothetical protein Vretifemale_657 [Volvox reticuliferus]GIM05645.1 hypothetical protein Vretimale_10097 [Volvox reticuliferus]